MQPPDTKYVDLHLHTWYSDGTNPPSRVVERAAALGIAAIAVTDHDAVAGLDEARSAADRAGIEFLDGVEISAGADRLELHIVGLGIHPDDPALGAALRRLQQARSRRADKIIARLNELGVPVRRANIEARTANGVIGRLHIAQEVEALGFVKTVQGAFAQYIGAGRPAYVPKERLPCTEAIDVIHGAGGLAFLGHPGIGGIKNHLEKLLRFPFDGIEAYHSKHSPGETEGFTLAARDHGLLVAGGSDCHGSAKKRKAEMGTVRMPYEYYRRVKETLAKNAAK